MERYYRWQEPTEVRSADVRLGFLASNRDGKEYMDEKTNSERIHVPVRLSGHLQPNLTLQSGNGDTEHSDGLQYSQLSVCGDKAEVTKRESA